MTTAATLGTSIEATLNSVKNEDMVRGLQDIAFDLKFGLVTVPATTSEGTTHTVNLWNEFGIKRFLGVKGFAHTTKDSVIVTENPTTSVDNDILTLTVAASNDDAKRVYLIIGV